MATTPPETIDDLGLPAALYLGALLEAQTGRARVAPTQRMTLVAMGQLRDCGLVEVPRPEARWEPAPNVLETPIEGLQWRYLWGAYPFESAAQGVREYLEFVPRDDLGTALRLKIWRELVVAEVERYFEQQLVRHHFEATWARDVVFVHKALGTELSAAQWRYCCWAATRHGASVALQQRGQEPERVREAIFVELQRRVGLVAAGQWATTFVPYVMRPESALGRLFVSSLTHLADTFWTMPPSEAALLATRPSREYG
jgi:hypothetical protein